MPIFRWVGGKQQLLPRLLEFCPHDVRSRRYFEPFLGAASLFLALRPQNAVLGDANAHLIDTYSWVRRAPARVASHLARLINQDCADHYYTVRDTYNRSKPSAAQAARFIYLNRTCFNGIFRVNKQGKFNVPYGYKQRPACPSRKDLEHLGAVLSNADIVAGPYQDVLERAGKGDFVYLDPPYPALNGTSYFTHYTMSRFSHEDQGEVATLVRELDRRGCLVMVSNADTAFIRDIYRGFAINKLTVTRWVTCKAVKHAVDEVVVTNY